ncbi:MAG: RluA family pseudouridine synthase [Candidatus Aminicenantes bacterium]|nr:RluA family pseudouridine synthase [Candidatus Aminicenantes bacterium]
MKKSVEFRVNEYWERIDHYLSGALHSLSRSRIAKLIQGGRVTLNGGVVLKKSREIFPGDRIVVEIESEDSAPYSPTQALTKLFEDEWLLVIDKPSGLPVHPGAGRKRETVLDIFRHEYPQVGAMAEKERPGIVHRLDKDTSGALILAKSEEAVRRMQTLFQEREMQKTYLALVAGSMRFRNGAIDRPLARSLRNRARFEVAGEDREDRRQALTEFSVIREFASFSFVKLMPHTGRTHQLRVHLAHFGNPVLGDVLYGRSRGKDFPRLALHAFRIEFDHPFTGEHVQVTSPLPPDLKSYMIENFKSQIPITQ